MTLVCATRTEERAAKRLGARTAVAGIGARGELPEGPLVSFGLAGGLHDGLDCGEVLDATRVVDADGSVLWEGGPLGAPGARTGTIVVVDAVLDSPEERRRLHERTGADAADMESGALARSGRLAGCLRAISDTPSRTLGPLADDAPLYDRPHVPTPARAPLGPVASDSDVGDDLVRLMGSPDLASRRWIWEQYDHMVGADTVQRPGGDAAIVRIHDSAKGLAIATDCTPRYCFADPVEGGRQAIAECWRNLTAVGAVPLAATDCMNFGNPQRPEVMGQFVGCIDGMAEACAALAFPIVSGNVSLYNETKADDGSGRAILPTPAIGGIGLIDDVANAATIAFKAAGESIWLIGTTHGHLGQSLWLREIAGREDGPPPPVDLDAERRTGTLVRWLIGDGLVTAVHDCADGGLLVALGEMALAGRVGAAIDPPADGLSPQAWFFGEDQARYLVTSDNDEALAEACRAAAIPAVRIGRTGGEEIAVAGARVVPLDRLRKSHEAFLPRLMRQPA